MAKAIQAKISLPDLAERINKLAEEARDTHLEFCRSLAEAQDRVLAETNLTFAMWADEYLRRPDGSKWTIKTLYTYAHYGRNPEALVRDRSRKIDSQRITRATARQAAEESERPRLPVTRSISDEVNLLMTIWERTSAEARRQFLDLVHARA